jgi:hypothetical protein
LQVGGWFTDKSVLNRKKDKEKQKISNSLIKQAYRFGQLAKLQVGGWFADKSASNNKKVKTDDTFARSQNLKTKSECFSNSLIKQTYRFGQLAKLQVDGWFANKSTFGTKKAQADVPQYGRILPICAKDTPHFWSDVYKLGTRARKAQADLVQGGRSMIEMLGVLAIIGVLSVGGIAGYTKAMRMYNSNLQRRQISELMQASLEIQPSFRNYKTSTSVNLPVAIEALGYVPEGLTLNSSNNRFEDKFGNQIKPYFTTGGYISITIVMNSSQKTTTEADDYCFNIFSVGKEYADFLSNVQLNDTTENESGSLVSSVLFISNGNKYCRNNSENCLKNLTPIKIKQACNLCVEKIQCRLHFDLLPPYK